jgi:hypothetical protein
MFGRLRMSVEQVKILYPSIMSAVFSDKKRFGMGEEFKLDRLEKVMKEILLEHTGDECSQMLDMRTDKGCKVCVPSKDDLWI